ncbi:uncharacterized protein LOC128436469 [Pleuronectes platessa]|uniref:uncharacterized protein LOC128436469 n=1 Tax=Pleuronectes platessa TaxID=8262 RepID=UPI00232A13EF|nr:uncharacterized protein LOC128436469 [Pleuronectes platessa]
MGNCHSKGATNAAAGDLSPLCKLMSEQYPGSLDQIQVWTKLGFPAKGSLSENQLNQLKTQLKRLESLRNPDLDSTPPAPPPYVTQQKGPYTPVVTRQQAQQRLSEIRDERKSPAAIPTMPMVEVAGAEGPILVFRPWSEADVAEAMNYICNPKDNLNKWENDLLQFVREFRPTMFEIRRLMNKTLTNDYHSIQNVFNAGRMTARLENPDFGHRDNADFRNAIEALVVIVREKFPLRMNLSNITSMTQKPSESCSSFLARLTSAFDTHTHSGLIRPDLMGRQPLEPYEVHLKEHFLSRMKPELAQTIKKFCVTWKTCPLAEILQHAEHAEDELLSTDEQRKQGRQRKLEDAQLSMINVCANMSPGPFQGQPRRGRGRGRNRGGGRFNSTHASHDPDVCFHCGRRGHWQAECPRQQGQGPIFSKSD